MIYEILLTTSRIVRTGSIIVTCLAAIFLVEGRVYSQIPNELLKDFGDIVEGGLKKADKMVPGLLSEVSEEEFEELSKVEISIQEERRFGKQLLSNYETALNQSNKKISRKGRDVDYLHKLIDQVKPLMRNAKRYSSINVAVVRDTTADAYSFPGGELLFTTGLLETAGSEAALVGVVAHELSHLDHGHQLYTLRRVKKAQESNEFVHMPAAIAAVAKPFNSEFESQADKDAFIWMLKLDYDPRELVALLQSWDQKQNDQLPWLDLVPNFAKTHPDPGKRANSLEDRFSEAKNKDDLYVGRENLKQRITKLEKRFDE